MPSVFELQVGDILRSGVVSEVTPRWDGTVEVGIDLPAGTVVHRIDGALDIEEVDPSL